MITETLLREMDSIFATLEFEAMTFSSLGRHRESETFRGRSLRAAERVAATLVDEPALQASFLRRVTGALAFKASA